MAKKGEKERKDKIPFYERKSSMRLCRIAGTASGIMVLLSPFFSWKVAFVRTDSWVYEKVTLFDLVRFVFSKNFNGKAIRQIIPLFLLLIIMLMGALMLYITWRDQYRPGTAAESGRFIDKMLTRFRPVSRLIPPVLATVSAILMTHTSTWNIVYERVNSTYISWKSMIENFVRINGRAHGMFAWKLPGIGFTFLCLGIAFYLFAETFRYLINTLNEED